MRKKKKKKPKSEGNVKIIDEEEGCEGLALGMYLLHNFSLTVPHGMDDMFQNSCRENLCAVVHGSMPYFLCLDCVQLRQRARFACRTKR
jgi:hypothetical protein